MYRISVDDLIFNRGTAVKCGDELLVTCPKEGAEIVLRNEPGMMCGERLGGYNFFSFDITALGDVCVGFWLTFDKPEAVKHEFGVVCGILPQFKAEIGLPFSLFDGQTLFVERANGRLKMVVQGNAIDINQVSDITITTYPSEDEYQIKLGNFKLLRNEPKYETSDEVLTDLLGQDARKSWEGKSSSPEALSAALRAKLANAPLTCFADASYSRFGGDTKMKLADGSGYFTTYKTDERWLLVDPEGYAFFSNGLDCVGASIEARYDVFAKNIGWLPIDDDYYAEFMRNGWNDMKSFNVCAANLKRALGAGWKADWERLMCDLLRGYNINTIGNWSDTEFCINSQIPFVFPMNGFPSTKQRIFRDFPDVFSDEYERASNAFAEQLKRFEGNPYLIGYFLRNEPEWAFVNGICVAEEVLASPERTASKIKLIDALRAQYGTIGVLNAAWNAEFADFNDLLSPVKDACKLSTAAEVDLREFSRVMIERYVSLPSKACKAIDPHHLNLGMRYAWISSPELAAGWENFDVYTINCYDMNPYNSIDNIGKLGIDLPVMIGEYHFGALDAGLPATGLRGVTSQAERGVAYRYYAENAAAHKLCVGCHYFQLYDQFYTGRFDGENYQIGMLDVCSMPYTPFMEAVSEVNSAIYEVVHGKREPSATPAKEIFRLGF